jgi:hypothetical protein
MKDIGASRGFRPDKPEFTVGNQLDYLWKKLLVSSADAVFRRKRPRAVNAKESTLKTLIWGHVLDSQ